MDSLVLSNLLLTRVVYYPNGGTSAEAGCGRKPRSNPNLKLLNDFAVSQVEITTDPLNVTSLPVGGNGKGWRLPSVLVLAKCSGRAMLFPSPTISS